MASGSVAVLGEPVARAVAWAKRKPHRGGDRGIGSSGERRRHLHDGPDAAQVAERDEQRHLGLEHAKRAHGLGEGRRGSD